MPLRVFDRTCETTTTTGTGAVSLAGAITGFVPFGDNVGNGETFYYLIEGVDASSNQTGEWEVGIGTLVTGSPNTITRTTVIYSSAGLSTACTFSAGTKRVHLTAPAAQIGFLGGVYTKSADLTAANFTSSTALTWNTNTIDTHLIGSAFHDTVTNTSRITMPTTYKDLIIEISVQVSMSLATAADWADLIIKKNGTTVVGRNMLGSGGTTSPCLQASSQILQTTSADYYEAYLQVQSDASITIVAAQSHFQFKVLQ
jgi:hypothetical protein